MPVELQARRTPSANLFIEACKHVGFKYNRDYNGVSQFGVTFQHQNSKDGSRFSTARGYLKGIHRKRPNLTILLERRCQEYCSDFKFDASYETNIVRKLNVKMSEQLP